MKIERFISITEDLLISEIEELKSLGIRYGRLDFFDESEEEIQEIFKKCHISKKV